MKKLIAALVLLMVLVSACGLALAGEVSLGSTGLTLTLPSGWQEDSLDATDIAEGALCYWYNDTLDMAVYLSDADVTLDEMVEECRDDNEITEAGYVSGQPGGLSFGYFVYPITDDQDVYYAVEYFAVNGSQMLEIIFYMDDTSSTSQAESILRTLKAAGSTASAAQTTVTGDSVAIGTTGLRLTLPTGFVEDALTQEDIADDMVAYWYSDLLDIIVYEEDGEGVTDSDVMEELQEEGITQYGTTEMPSGIDFVYAVLSYTEDNETLVEVAYYTVTDNKLVSILFVMTDAEKEAASAQSAAIIETVTK